MRTYRERETKAMGRSSTIGLSNGGGKRDPKERRIGGQGPGNHRKRCQAAPVLLFGHRPVIATKAGSYDEYNVGEEG